MPQIGLFQLGQSELGAPTAPSYPQKTITGVGNIRGITTQTLPGVANIWTPAVGYTRKQTITGKAWLGTSIIFETAQAYLQVQPAAPSSSIVAINPQIPTNLATVSSTITIALAVVALAAATVTIPLSTLAGASGSGLTSFSPTIGGSPVTIIASQDQPEVFSPSSSSNVLVYDSNQTALTSRSFTAASTFLYASQPPSANQWTFSYRLAPIIIKIPFPTPVWTGRIITGKASLMALHQRTITGVAHIGPTFGTSTQTITGRARIYGTTTRTISGVANLLPKGSITGRANIRRIAPQAITGVANIIPASHSLWETQAVLEWLSKLSINQIQLTQEVLESILFPGINQVQFTQNVLEFIRFPPNQIQQTQVVLEVVVGRTNNYIAMGNSLVSGTYRYIV